MSKSLLRSTTLVSSNTLLSRILGFVRDIVFAHYFGAAGGFDAFIIAFRIPNFTRRLFAEGAFSQAFVPVLSQYRYKCSHAEVRQFISHMMGVLFTVLFCVTIFAVLASPLIISIFAPGFLHDKVRFVLAVKMLRITSPYILFISLTALCSSILNSYDSFGIPAFTPVLLNVLLILGAVFAAQYFSTPVYALAWAVFAAGIVQLIFQLPFLKHKKLLPKPAVRFRDSGVRRVLKLMTPALFGVSVAQFSILLDTIFASFLQTGSVSWLYYSERLMNFPLGVFAVAIATVILPKLSRCYADEDSQAYSKTLDWALRLLLLIGLPSALGMLILAGPLLSTLFQGGEFGHFAVLMSRKSLMAFAVGIQAFMMIKVLVSGFYAKQDIITPVKIAVFAVAANMILNAVLIFPLAHAGLALATSLAAFVNAGFLLFLLLKRKIYVPEPGWRLYLIRLIAASALMGIFLFYFSSSMSAWLMHARLWRIIHLVLLVIGGMMLYFICLFMSGLRIKHFRI